MSSDPELDGWTPSDGHRWISGPPKFPHYSRACEVADVPDVPLPPAPEYTCKRVTKPIVVDGRLDEDEWSRAEWTSRFGRIGDGRLDGLDTRAAFLWDDDHLYVAFKVEDHDIRATHSRHHEHVYIYDDDAEVFIEGPRGYYEIGVNPINIVYELRWTWLAQLIDNGDAEGLDRLLRLTDTLYYAPRGGERYGRIGDLNWELPGVQHAVQVDGTINNPQSADVGWTAEFALPWQGLAQIGLGSPTAGMTFRAQGYRALHDRTAQPIPAPEFPGAYPYEGYTWSPMGNGNVHNPERWATLLLSDTPA